VAPSTANGHGDARQDFANRRTRGVGFHVSEAENCPATGVAATAPACARQLYTEELNVVPVRRRGRTKPGKGKLPAPRQEHHARRGPQPHVTLHSQMANVLGIGWDVGGWIGRKQGVAVATFGRDGLQWRGQPRAFRLKDLGSPRWSLLDLIRLAWPDVSYDILDNHCVALAIDAPLGSTRKVPCLV
jgi:hypothetical protein